MHLRGVISKIRAKWGMVIIGDSADPISAIVWDNFWGFVFAVVFPLLYVHDFYQYILLFEFIS